MNKKTVISDVLIIGGGTAGCYAAITLGERSDLDVVIVDKADIRRSGCLAAGVNALNCYITDGHEPMDYVRYASSDAEGIAREDLLLDLTERVNCVTADMERRGLTILKDENGKYVSRGWRNLKINGENIKPILASEVKKLKHIRILQHINITDLLFDEEGVHGACGFGINDGAFYEFRARAVLIATGGAAGLYRPNNSGEMAHQMWYCPFNTGAGYAMGILAGAEMTSFEMRFIALRCKDTIAPTGTIAQGVHARQVNSRGEIYESKYGLKTSERLWGTVMENREGRGPCFLKTSGIGKKAEQDLFRAYLNMAPLQTLKWLESGGPDENDVEIEGTEPYVVGGHTASGYWVNRDRMTTVNGLFAAGDVAGGAPQKYVTGALAEGEIAAEGIMRFLGDKKEFHSLAETHETSPESECKAAGSGSAAKTEEESHAGGTGGRDETGSAAAARQAAKKKAEYERYLKEPAAKRNADDRYAKAGGDEAASAAQAAKKKAGYERYLKAATGNETASEKENNQAVSEKSNRQSQNEAYLPEKFEAAMQKIMDEYAGGIRTDYVYTEAGLEKAERGIRRLLELLPEASVRDTDDLLAIYEVRERLIVSLVLIYHLRARKETRWHGFAENADHPGKDPSFECYINSVFEGGEIKMKKRPLIHVGS